MPLPSAPNPISLLDIGTEFEDTAPHSMSEFYGVGAPPVQSSGPLSFGDFHGKANHPENVWTYQAAGGVNTSFAHDTQNFTIDFGSDKNNWTNNDLIILCPSVYTQYTSSGFLTPSGWTNHVGTSSSGWKGNASIFSKFIQTSDILSNTSTLTLQLQPYSSTNSYGNQQFGVAWWRFRSTVGVSGHTSITTHSTYSYSTSTTTYNHSVPNMTGTFPNGISPILVGVGKMFSSSTSMSSNAPWTNAVSFRSMDSLALGYHDSSNPEDGWAASVQTWSNRSLPSQISGSFTGRLGVWAYLYTNP